MVAAVAAGCATAVAGTPVATTDAATSGTEQPSSTVSASIDPCALLTGADIQRLGLVSRGPDRLGPSRGCSWNKPGQYAVTIGVYDHDGFGDISTIGHVISNHPVGTHDGRQVLDDDGGCGIALAITALSLVVVAVSNVDETQECPLADQYAVLIEPRLPAQEK
jgi:Protein of unknown function (DUF3558)